MEQRRKPKLCKCGKQMMGKSRICKECLTDSYESRISEAALERTIAEQMQRLPPWWNEEQRKQRQELGKPVPWTVPFVSMRGGLVVKKRGSRH